MDQGLRKEPGNLVFFWFSCAKWIKKEKNECSVGGYNSSEQIAPYSHHIIQYQCCLLDMSLLIR